MNYEVLLFDSHPVILEGLMELFRGTEFLLSRSVYRFHEAMERLNYKDYHLVILDTRLVEGNGLGVLEKLRVEFPKVPVLVFSDTENPAHIAQCNALGAAGFRNKNCDAKTLLDSCRAIVQGRRLWTVDEIRKLTGAMSTPRLGTGYDVSLTNREVQVIGQMADGATNKEIANRLGISFETVKEHVQHILKKIGVSDRTQAVVWAVRAKVI